MDIRTNKIVLKLRDIGRFLGINNYLAIFLSGERYEDAYDREFHKTIKPCDCLWDIGANIGHYTQTFSEMVTEHGSVIAFEPSPSNFTQLNKNCKGLANVMTLNVGLGSENGLLPFQQGADDIGATSRIVENSDDGVFVPIRRGDSLIEDGTVKQPNSLKIDVEGFELEVLNSFGEKLNDPKLHTVGVEVHFEILKSRSFNTAPAQIVALLKNHGFLTSWPDHSHLIARRV